MPLPPDFEQVRTEAWSLVRDTMGYLTRREADFLTLAAAVAPARGAILEIGSFKGRSTVGLAYVARHYGLGKVVAVDPHTSPSATDPDLRGAASSWDAFCASLRRAGVEEIVEPHRTFSTELARNWNEPLRLLWIDGDHTYPGAKADLEAFRPHLVQGSIVALHDALRDFGGPTRVFVEEILRSDDYGPAGVCGSIAWAQYRPSDGGEPRFREARKRLESRMAPLVPLVRDDRKLSGARKLYFKVRRAMVPRGEVDPGEFAKQVALTSGSEELEWE